VLLREGCSVVIIDEAELAKTGSELSNYGNVLAIPTDVTDMDDVMRLVGNVVERFGKIDILIRMPGFSEARYLFMN